MSVLMGIAGLLLALLLALPGEPAGMRMLRVALAASGGFYTACGLIVIVGGYFFEQALASQAHWTADDFPMAAVISVPGLIGLLAAVGPRFRFVRVAGWWLSFPVLLVIAAVASVTSHFNPVPLGYAALVAVSWRNLVTAWRTSAGASAA